MNSQIQPEKKLTVADSDMTNVMTQPPIKSEALIDSNPCEVAEADGASAGEINRNEYQVAKAAKRTFFEFCQDVPSRSIETGASTHSLIDLEITSAEARRRRLTNENARLQQKVHSLQRELHELRSDKLHILKDVEEKKACLEADVTNAEGRLRHIEWMGQNILQTRWIDQWNLRQGQEFVEREQDRLRVWEQVVIGCHRSWEQSVIAGRAYNEQAAQHRRVKEKQLEEREKKLLEGEARLAAHTVRSSKPKCQSVEGEVDIADHEDSGEA
ncbi:hypothetical protein EDC01DRAFT_630696 [Geopyxis carbonaria]|nr:hypothetical protein EDC01DRAFT_630696 [Geopyxis carbonaria]